MRNSNVLVFSIAMNGYQWLYRPLRDTHERYTERNGYEYVQVTRPASSLLGMEIAWLKVTLALKSLDAGYDWVVFLDADTAVSHKTPAIESLAEAGKYLYAVKGYSGRLNSGVLIFRNHAWVRGLLTKILEQASEAVEPTSQVGWGENGHFIEYTKGATQVRYMHPRWNNNQYQHLDDYIRHYSAGPLQRSYKSNFWQRCLFYLQFHTTCKARSLINLASINAVDFHSSLNRVTHKVVERYPAFSTPPFRTHIHEGHADAS